jgi:uncharacterized repeat protein (TIGR04138 family)
MQEQDILKIVASICREDPRFDRKAYEFLRLGLDFTVKEMRRKDPGRLEKTRHLTGPELLEGLRLYALDQFGPLAKTVLNSWGVRTCQDFGDIVFNLIEYNVLTKTESDKREDFRNLYSFEEAFVRPFQASRPNRGTSAAEALGPA